jgi:hypothetical protein
MIRFEETTLIDAPIERVFGKTELRDTFAIAAPLPIFGPIAEALFLRRYMIALNRERNAVIRQLAGSDDWQLYVRPQVKEPQP